MATPEGLRSPRSSYHPLSVVSSQLLSCDAASRDGNGGGDGAAVELERMVAGLQSRLVGRRRQRLSVSSENFQIDTPWASLLYRFSPFVTECRCLDQHALTSYFVQVRLTLDRLERRAHGAAACDTLAGLA